MAFLTLCQVEKNTQKGQVSFFVHSVCLHRCFKMQCATYGRQRFHPLPGPWATPGTWNTARPQNSRSQMRFVLLAGELFSSCLLLFTGTTAAQTCEGVQQPGQCLKLQTPPRSLCHTKHSKDKFQSSHSTSLHKTQQQSAPILMQVFERVCGSWWSLSAAYEPWVGWAKLY